MPESFEKPRSAGDEKHLDARAKKMRKYAGEVLRLSRDTLIVNLRFMDSAISRLELKPYEDLYPLAVTGKEILYDPETVLNLYMEEREIIPHALLHMILHCVFRHFFFELSVERTYWDLATDIAVENMIPELNLPGARLKRSDAQKRAIDEIRSKVKYMTAEHLYAYLVGAELSEREIRNLQNLFSFDDHENWYVRIYKLAASNGNSGVSDDLGKTRLPMQGKGSDRDEEDPNENGDGTGNGTGDKKRDGKGDGTGNGTEDETSENGPESLYEREDFRKMLDDWKNLSEHIQTDMETYQKQRGTEAGNLVQNLRHLNREHYDYAAFLKKFAVRGEAMKVNEDEFDYIYYSYGMHLYEKMPLVEPLEYKDMMKIREFVIAIDTSGSTSGELVQTFMQKTYNILKQTENFFSKINLHIIQCDAEIQNVAKITSQEEFDEYLKNAQIYGHGGTDFRPVFQYVEEKIREKEFRNLKGMIYFTDGYGVFPKKQPPFETAFVYVDDGYNNYDVPVWAIKLILTPEDIRGAK